ncbi:PREDICTED: exocyst complex component EXO70B1-like [Tarenaya hassleriana]|uniref:exocyst complex component EXO70B1-like n=1 Tax=Tarenaya hassleriana TaxID=28532 RepID=UPI00053C3C7F|nr:PREDICTED: exocyst complex component EXO70B1-like [Tarenaya hassleriana]
MTNHHDGNPTYLDKLPVEFILLKILLSPTRVEYIEILSKRNLLYQVLIWNRSNCRSFAVVNNRRLRLHHLSLLSDYNTVLADILAGSPPPEKSLLPESYFDVVESDDSPATELTIRVAWLILVLLCRIDHKAKHYKDLSLTYIFLANNLQHVVSRAGSSNLKHLLGEDWVVRHFAKVRQFAASYERLAWGPVASSLPENSIAAAMSPEEVKDLFEAFNASFESAYGKQSACVVPDPKIRDEMKTSVARKLVTIYREFYYTHRSTVALAGGENGAMNVRLVVRFTPEDIGNYISALFIEKGSFGNERVLPSPSSSSSTSPSSRGRLSRS